jgi:hypothetical protein
MSLLSTAARTVADWVKLGFPEEVAKRMAAGGVAAAAATQSDDAEAGFVTRGGKTLLEAWHGSPHKFDRFSMDQIGTGEGAQAYGHGLYFADSEDVAKGYREALTQPRIETNGKAVPSPYTSDILETFSDEVAEETVIQAESWADLFELQAEAVGKPINREVLDDWIEAVVSGKESEFPTELSRQMAQLEDDIGMSQNDVYDVKERVEDAFSMIGGNLSQIDSMDQISYVTDGLPAWARPVYDRHFDGKMMEVAPEGALYRTEIDVTPESLLDWDKPLSEQSEVVQEIARPYIEKLAKYGWENPESKKTGADLYSELTVTNPKASHEIASGLLSDRGIKGIRYLDGDSRAAGDGTSNYVIFDDSLINIAERGSADPRLLAGIAAGGGGMSAATAMSNKLAAAQAVKEQGDIRAPNSSLLHDFTMGARDLERRLEGSPASLLFPEGLVEYLEQANRAERPNAATRSWALLDFL